MSRGIKGLIIAGSICLLVGTGLAVSGLAMINFDFSKLDIKEYVTNIYEEEQPFSKIDIDCEVSSIEFFPTSETKTKIECYELENCLHTYEIKDDTLYLKNEVKRKFTWGFNFRSPKVKIYLPNTNYTSLDVTNHTGEVNIPLNFVFENVNIALTTGDVNLENDVTDTLNISATTGDIYVHNSSINKINISTTTGSIKLKNITADKGNIKASTGHVKLISSLFSTSINVETTTGGIHFDHFDSLDIVGKATTGNITGSLLTGKAFEAHSSTGHINVPTSTGSQRCKLTTTTGNIRISIVS